MADDKRVCPDCHGAGKLDEGPCSPPAQCERCGGTGVIKKDD